MGYPSLNLALEISSAISDIADAENNVDFFNTYNDFPVTGISERIYVDLSTGKNYRWTGSIYYDFSSSKEDKKVPITYLSSVAGIVTVDMSTITRVCMLNMTENVTSWDFINNPGTDTAIEFTLIWKQHPSIVFSCSSPATKTAGGDWQMPAAAAAIETIGIIVIDGTDRYAYPSTVLI